MLNKQVKNFWILIAKLTLLFSISLMTACGYQLRGSLNMPEGLKNVYITGATESLQSEMKSTLKASQAKLATSTQEAGIVIKVLKEDMKTRVISIGSTGKSAESEVDYYLRFQFMDHQNQPLMEEQTIEMSREFLNDQSAVLARSNEEAQIRNEIYRQAVRVLMARAKVALDAKKN